jgi:PadR family transcriptional regulator, regulatory protein PadR
MRMYAQLRSGLLETCVLAVLRRGDSYGYQIVKDVSAYLEISESTLYPILKRLESADCLTFYTVEHNGRLRKYYKLAPAGDAMISKFLEDWKTVTDVYNFIYETETQKNEGNHFDGGQNDEQEGEKGE